MANSQGINSAFVTETLDAVHDFGSDTFKAALYLTTASVGARTPAYTATGEVSGLNYVPGGVEISSTVLPKVSGNVTYWTPSADIFFPQMTLASAFNAVLLYNASKSNKALGVWTFTATTLAMSTFTLTVPNNTKLTALLRWRTN